MYCVSEIDIFCTWENTWIRDKDIDRAQKNHVSEENRDILCLARGNSEYLTISQLEIEQAGAELCQAKCS